MTNIQYTIRGVSQRLDARIRERASRERKSLNQTVLDVLKTGAGLAEEVTRYKDLDDLAGTWVHDSEFDKAIEEMHRVDPELWK
ncbi:MAG: antitoxin [Acidobacteriota bacterium]